jgi:hypothetical protein
VGAISHDGHTRVHLGNRARKRVRELPSACALNACKHRPHGRGAGRVRVCTLRTGPRWGSGGGAGRSWGMGGGGAAGSTHHMGVGRVPEPLLQELQACVRHGVCVPSPRQHVRTPHVVGVPAPHGDAQAGTMGSEGRSSECTHPPVRGSLGHASTNEHSLHIRNRERVGAYAAARAAHPPPPPSTPPPTQTDTHLKSASSAARLSSASMQAASTAGTARTSLRTSCAVPSLTFRPRSTLSRVSGPTLPSPPPPPPALDRLPNDRASCMTATRGPTHRETGW